jgi:uncharacterized protein
MEIAAWSILIVLTIAGVIGAFVPVMPGAVLILIGALIHKLMLPEVLSWWSILVLGGCVLLTLIIDFFGSVMGAKWSGAGRWGLGGAGCGALIGLFFGIPGLILGPLLGAFFGELVFAGRQMKEAMKAGIGAGVGFILATILRFVVVCLMVGWICVDIFWTNQPKPAIPMNTTNGSYQKFNKNA